MERQMVNNDGFINGIALPHQLRYADFSLAMQDVYDFLFDVNTLLLQKGLERLEDAIRPAIFTGMVSDMISMYLARHSRALVVNKYPNGHPDLIVKNHYANDSVKGGTLGVEIKCTIKKGAAVDMHSNREQWLCVFVYRPDKNTEPIINRSPTKFIEVYIAQTKANDYRRNERGPRGTPTSTLHKDGLKKFREGLIYIDES